MLVTAGFLLMAIAIAIGLLGPHPKLSDYIYRPTYAHLQNAKWATRGMISQGVMLVACAILWVSTIWIGRLFISVSFAVSILQFRRQLYLRRKWIGQAEAEMDEVVKDAPIPDAPPEFL